MSVLSAQSIRRRAMLSMGDPDFLGISPFVENTKQALGLSYGLTAAGYDIRCGVLNEVNADSIQLKRGGFRLISSLERIKVPSNLQVIVHDKSTWARRGLAIQNTVLEPGWEGYITLELSNHGTNKLLIQRGQPIAQLVFHELDMATVKPYTGKYQNQGAQPTQAIEAEETDAHE